MTRRSYVQIDGVLVDKDSVPDREIAADSGALWGDRHYAGQRATDGTPIDTRTKHREYMRARGLTTIDDFTEHNKTMERAREQFFKGVDPSRRADIERALQGRK